MNFFKILTLTIFALSASLAFGEDKPAVKSPTDILFEKVVAENTRDTIKAYDLYCKQLAEASARVAKSLEGIKADLNNTKKFTNLSITERADMMKEIDEKIKSVNEGAVGDGIVAKKGQEGDLLGEGNLAKTIVTKKGMAAYLNGKWWNWNQTCVLAFKPDGTMDAPNGGTWELNKGKMTVNMGTNNTLTPVIEDGNIVRFDGVYGNNIQFKVLLAPAPEKK